MTIRKAFDDYKTIYMPYRNFAERTREGYANDLADFVCFVESSGITRVDELGLPVIQRYVAHLEQKGYSGLTRKRKVVAIRSFVLFLYQDEYIPTNLSARIAVPFTEASNPRVLTKSECEGLSRACAANPRDAAIIEILLQTGIRLSELIRLTINDVDWAARPGISGSGGFLRVVGSRGRKERVVLLDFPACVKLRKYLSTRNGLGSETLFLNRFGKSLGDRGVQKLLGKHLKAAGIAAASIHALRHTFGAGRIAEGVDRKKLQEEMGLRDIRSTSVYGPFGKQ